MSEILPSSILSPGALGTVFALVAIYAISYVLKSPKSLSHIPLLGKAADKDFRDAVREGYKKGTLFRMPTQYRDTVILPIKFLDEVKSLPESIVSFDQEIQTRFIAKYTGMETEHPLLQSIKVDLTRQIASTLDALQDELIYAGETEIGACEEWTGKFVYPTLLRMVALLSGRVFVGLPLCRDERWIQATIRYTIDTFNSARELLSYPAWTRPIVAPFLKSIQTVKESRREGAKIMAPVFEARLEEMKQPGYKKRADLIEWAIGNSGPKATDVKYQARMQLLASLGAIHTTTMNVSHCLYDLVSHPEHFQPLREEIQGVLDTNNGVFVKSAMTKLRKLDSFIKESQRVNPPGLVTMLRQVMSDYELSDGTKLKKGMSIAFASGGVNQDPSIWKDPEVFDGFRFEKLRNEPGSENKYQFVTTGANALSFGHGLHACPGRFFASNEIKLLLSHLILNYDIKLKDGETARPPNTYNDTTISPNVSAELLFKKRQV